jgi:beta-lactam-binding protein with PASTA domain
MLFEMITGRVPFTGDTPLSVAYQHVNTDVPAPSTLAPGIPAAVDELVVAATSRDPARRPADAGEFLRAVRAVRTDLYDPNGLAGVMGAGVQGLGEAPWLDLDTPAATNGWWTRTGALPTANANGTGPSAVAHTSAVPIGAGQFGTGSFGTGSFGTGSFGTGSFGTGQFGTGQFGGGARDDVSSHTLVVHREDGGRYLSGREPFLQRWLFSPRLLIIALILVLGVALGIGGWWLTSGRYAQVPGVAGDSVATATAALTADGFVVDRDAQARSNTVPKGTVLGTSPAGRVSKGTRIALLVSSGPFTSVVPNLQNDSLAAAQAALQRLHLASTTAKVGSNSPVGTVTGTIPVAGTSWPQNKPVVIQVSSGPPLPNFVGENVQAAQQWAAQHGVTINTQPDNNSQQAAGTVTGQQPAAGATFTQGETVTVTVSTGPQVVNVPSPIGMSVAQATQLLQQAGFQVKVNNYGPFAKVFDFSPVGQAPRGSTITLDVGF